MVPTVDDCDPQAHEVSVAMVMALALQHKGRELDHWAASMPVCSEISKAVAMLHGPYGTGIAVD